MRRAVFAACVLGAAMVPRVASAIPYETFIDVSSQSELEDLLASGDITQDTYDELLDLLSRGVDLNEADRSELYALPNLTYEDVDKIIALRTLNKGVIRDPADLFATGALSQEKLLAIAAFITSEPPGANKLPIRGWVRAITRFSYTDDLAPPLSLRSRVSIYTHWQAGIAITTTRLRVGAPTYDPNRDALVAEGRSYQVHVPKGYLKYEDDHYEAIAGTYRAGFAQRLVFDNSSTYTPNGLYADDEVYYSSDLDRVCRESAGELATSPCAGEAASEYTTPDFATRNGLFGVGVGVRKFELASGWLQAFAWGSVAGRNIYQYELFDRGKCEDPHDDSDPACAAPTVYKQPDGDLLDPTTRFSFTTLPNVFSERLAGGNVSYYADRRNSIGATVYAANEKSLVGGADLDFQEWSRYPYGGTFGAAGGNFSLGRGWLDVFGEAAYSFDKMVNAPGAIATGGGGPAAILRITATRKHEELETVLRYYSTDYANPYARPISQADEFDGQRARDEVGARVRYVNQQKLFTIRALVDVWVPPSTLKEQMVGNQLVTDRQPKLETYVRADVRTSKELWLGLWERYQDKDLSRGGHDQCFEVSTETSETGEPVPCGGRQLTSIARAKYVPMKGLSFTLLLQHQLLDDDALSETAWRQDLAGWIIALWQPTPEIRLRARARYLDEAIEDSAYLERSVSTVIEAAFRLRKADTLRVRLDNKYWLDDRAATALRAPNPEATFWLSYEAKI